MDSLRFLNGIYYATMALCGIIGLTATSFVIEFTAGLAVVAVYMARVIIDAMCEPA